MRAKKVYETQNFEQGIKPYKKMDIGLIKIMYNIMADLDAFMDRELGVFWGKSTKYYEKDNMFNLWTRAGDSHERDINFFLNNKGLKVQHIDKINYGDEDNYEIYLKPINESVINPYDKIGVMMAQEYGVDLGFEKTEDGLGVKQKPVDKIKTNRKPKDPFKTKKLGFKP